MYIRSAASLALGLALAFVISPAAASVLNPPTVEARRAFVTSSTHTGNLGGLAGADAICQQRASEGLLPNPSGFVAFLSDSTTDAYCHVHGLLGTRADNCGLATLPTDAGPWVRTDGFPFADRIDGALDPVACVFSPLALDEHGVLVSHVVPVWTNTDTLGAFHSSYPSPCSDWTSTTGNAGHGEDWSTSQSWVSAGGLSCSIAARLYCVESGPAKPLPPHRSGGALVFVTSTGSDGNLGELAGADALCVARATAAGLPAPTSFVAWLSDAAVDAIARLTYDGPWVRLDGVLVATGKADLVDETLHAPINLTETGEYLGNWGVWSGTLHSGNGTGSTCSGWATGAAGVSAHYGRANSATYSWTYFSTASCNSNFRLYCFSNFPAIVFVDDFESSDSLAWSATVTP